MPSMEVIMRHPFALPAVRLICSTVIAGALGVGGRSVVQASLRFGKVFSRTVLIGAMCYCSSVADRSLCRLEGSNRKMY